MEQDDIQSKSSLPDLETLKGRLEQQEAAKIKAEQIVSTLSRIKAREKASRRRITSRDDSIISSPVERKPATNNAVKEKSNLLKRKLEEDRAKVESQRGSESLNKVNEVVETLKAQLEDRDKLMQQLFLNAQQSAQSDADNNTSVVNEPTPSVPEIPDEIKQKIADLEAKIIDLQENLREKDNVISARTQAITLLSEDLSKKNKSTLDTLEETQEQMRQMQNNFINIEEKMKKEHQRLKEEAEDKKQRCLQAEKSLRIVEAARFDLSTRVAELQEKVVALQTKNIELEKQFNESEAKQTEFKDALDTAKNTTVKLKAQFKIKMKALEEERDLLKKTNADGNAVTSLQERIAELEEEKEQFSILKERIVELEGRLSQQCDDLDSHVKAMSKIELEKLDLIQVVQERNNQLSEKDILIERLQNQLTEVEQLKVSSEMRAIELEEKLDGAIKNTINTNHENQNDVDNLKQQLILQEETIRELKTKLLARQNEISQGGGDSVVITDLSSELEEWKRKYLDMEIRYNEVNGLYSGLESRLEQAEKHNDLIASDCDKFKLTVVQLQSTVHQFSSQGIKNESVRTESVPESSVHVATDEKDTEINRLREELSSTTLELHRLSTALDKMNITGEQIDELNHLIVEKDKALTDVSNELEKRTRKLSEYKKFHKLKSEDVLRVSHELENVTLSSQERISELEQELAKASDKELELQKQIKELKEKENQGTVPVTDQMTQKMKKIAASLKIKAKTCKDLEEKLENLKKSLEEKQNLIEDLVAKENKNLQEISELKCQLGEVQSLSVTKSFELQHTPNLSNELEGLIKERDNLNSQVSEQQQIIDQLQNDVMISREEKEEAFSQIEKIQENEFTKNEALFQMFERQVNESKMEILHLQEQLSDVASKYEQAWAKLQEKDAYIESIESELSKAQERMRTIESSTNEARQNLQDKTELLGERLKRTEEINAQFEKYKSDIEQRLSLSIENEKYLQNSLADKTAENEELKSIIKNLNYRIEQFEKECFDMRNYIGNLQNEIANLHDIQESHNRNIDEIERLNNEINKIKSAHEKMIAEFREKEKITLDSTEIELKNLSDKCTAIESDRQQLLREYENAQQQMLVLKEEIEKQKSDFEMRYTYLESERNHYEKLYAELKQEINNSEEKFSSLSEVKSKEVENIMNEQKLLLEKLHAEFQHKEQLFFNRIKELEDYNIQLQESLRTIESNAESLKHELNKVGVELSASNEELIELRQDQEKSSSLKNEIDNYGRQLEEERERVKILEMELLREKAKKEVESVVMEAESKVDSITQAKQSVITTPPLFKFTDVNQDQLDLLNTFESLTVGDNQGFNIGELRSRLSSTLAENERLTGIITEYERNKTTVETEMANVIVRHENKDEEDGWGWGGDEVGMESDAVTIATISEDKPTALQHSDARILELEQRLHELELENSRVTEELKNSQIRCSKLVKKAKELKAKSEGLERGTREKSLGFEDLDFAMQEELRGQIEKLEKSLQESMNENKNWKTEKEHLLRKVDTLTSGNERLIEMKERQDIELSIFEKQNSDLKQQVLGFEWKVEELMEDHERLTANCTEMEEKINSLATENEQLMKIVSDMKDLQKGNDHQTVSQGQTQNPMFTLFKEQTSETEHKSMYDSLLIKYEQLTNKKDEIVSINTSLMDKINSFNVRINELEIENYDLKNRIENYKASSEDSKDNTELTEEIKKLQCSLQISEEKLKEYESKIEHLENENKKLLEQSNSLRNAEKSLKLQMDNQIDLINDDMDKRYNDTLHYFNKVNNELQEITRDRENLIQKLQKLENEKTNDIPKVMEVVNEPSSASVLFHGFGDDSSTADPFGLPVEGTGPREPSVSPTFAAWSNDSNQPTKRESRVNIDDLKKQITSLTSLLIEKEQELEMSKQLIDKDSLERQNLQDLQTEQNTINENQFDAYEDVLNAAEQKYKDNLISKEEEIAHLTCELSSKDQQLINIKKEITNLMNHEKELNLLVEKYKVENDLQQKELIKFQEECIKLNGKINKLTDSETEYSSKVNYLESQLRSIEQQYLDCVEVMKEENRLKMNIEHEYSLCVEYIEERNKIILEKEREIEQLKLKLDMVDDAHIFNGRNNESSQADETSISGVIVSNQPTVQTTMPTNDNSQTIPSDKSHDVNINTMDEHIVRFKEMIKQRDLEIDRLMEALGEAEERLIKMEEQRLSSDEVTRLQLKLDEALYTVHLRDIRCEELTLELMQLLEERDTLQLRLSTALRMSEELRRKVSVPVMVSNLNNEQISTNDSGSCTTRTSDAEHNQSSSDQETTHSDTENCRLNEKLGELHNTGYQRDLSLHQDRIKRHNEQVHLFSSTNSPQSSTANANIEDHNASGGFFSWIFGSAGSSFS